LGGATTATPVTPKVVRRKASFEGVVKHLTDLAVTISTDDGQKKLMANSDIFNGRGRDDDYTIQVRSEWINPRNLFQYFQNSATLKCYKLQQI
jgi:hypothetical protein